MCVCLFTVSQRYPSEHQWGCSNANWYQLWFSPEIMNSSTLHIGSQLGAPFLFLFLKATRNKRSNMWQHTPSLYKDETNSKQKPSRKPADGNSVPICFYSASKLFHKEMIYSFPVWMIRFPSYFNLDSHKCIGVNSCSFYNEKLKYPLIYIP